MQRNITPTETERRRPGRPPSKLAGDVDRRILNAATSLFLKLGFDATSCEQVVELAGAGKASLYARYASKEELFAAVVRDNVERTLAPSADVPFDLSLAERLRTVGLSILAHALQPDVVALMRVVLATAQRMPDLAQLADRIGRDSAVRRVAEAIAGNVSMAPGAIEKARPVAAKFIDLVFLPNQMRALLGDEHGVLMRGASKTVEDAIDLLTKGGWLKQWD